ncbi:flavin-containing monooxygenase [Thalassolituus marinus]|uniref:NAD(P)/FAD-dependent oxidoreductase n=1 Tax=Thalassolituus marinus TaxID=671053 RepID=A0ABS7ZT61_9GAMM|nr:NAD(P)/FAD-dependent oxidoreductase [Thalassolituus marinus]MCA6064924.1 NAD(P)/FAD-dependent oxidoreductase [Thalassolituus marinus]
MEKQHWDIVIIGAGVSGIGAAVRLLQQGFTDFIVLEKYDELGGTWRDNTYPGCACDVPSALYSYSFAQKPDWSRAFAGQAEILDYVHNTADKQGVKPFIRYGVDVQASRWNDAQQQWQLQTSAGDISANKLISAVGYLHEPIMPNLPGLSEFPGKVFHSSRWDHECDLRDKKVAVIGTGASAIQFIPEIQPQVNKLSVFQRTPQWILPKPDHRIPAIERAFFRIPLTLNSWRKILYAGLEVFGIGFRRPGLLKVVQKLAQRHLNSSIKDPQLRAKLTPDYTLGCKRVLLSNNYYPAMAKLNVDLHATGVEQIRGNKVVGQDGSEAEADVIILGTGFHVSDVPIAAQVFGRDGRSLEDIWQGSPQAYRGTCVNNFPNFFLILGPNLAIGNNSAFVVIESQLNYIMGAMQVMQRNQLQTVEVCAQKQDDYNQLVQDELQKTVWNTGGCSSYYLDKNGRNSIGFPWSSNRMQALLRHFDPESYQTLAKVDWQAQQADVVAEKLARKRRTTTRRKKAEEEKA